MQKQKKGRLKKRTKYALAAGGAAVIILAAAAVWWNLSSRDEGILFYVDGEPVYEEEVKFVIDKERLTVRNHIMTDNDVESGDFSWDAEYGGKKALDYLKETVLEDCKENKVIQIVARETGVADKIDYPSLKAMNEEDTKVRQERTDSGQVIYGNTSYKAADYYDYVLSNLEQQSYYRLVEDGTLDITDEEVQQIYEENKEALEGAGLDEETARTMGLQQKYADYIRQRADDAVIGDIDEEALAEVLESVK